MTFTDHDFQHWLESKRGTHGKASSAGKTQQGAQKRKAGPLLETEAGIQNAICEYLRYRQIPFTITEAKRSFNESGQLVRRISPGWPDLTCCYQSKMLAIEVKSAVGKLRPAQAETLAALWEAGAIVVVARGIEDVIAALKDGKHEASKVEIQKARKL